MTNDQLTQLQTRTLALLLLTALSLPCSLLAAPPKVNYLFPAGGQRGQTVSVAAQGDFSTWPVKVWADRPGITLEAEQDKGKLKLTVPPEAVPGVYWLRIYNEEGASPLRPFVVGTLPETEEAEPNDAPHQPQAIAQPIVVNGKLAKGGDVDGYSVALKQGQTLVATLMANSTLGSPMDAVVQVCELVERRGRPEAYVVKQNHDAIGLDPQIAFTAPREGQYLVRVFAFPAEPGANISFAGGDNFVYRLTITTGAYVDHALPLAVRPQQEVKLFGWNLPDDGLPAVLSPPDELKSSVAWHAEAAGSVNLLVTENASIVAAGSNNAPQPIELPAIVSGRIGAPEQVSSFAFQASKGKKLRFDCESRSLGYSLMAKLRIGDESGKQLAIAEPNERGRKDTELVFAPPADGRYLASISDLHGRGGLRFVYRLAIEAAQPDFNLTLAADSFVVAAGKQVEIAVAIERREGFAETIEIKAADLPPGVTAETVPSQATGDTAKNVKLILKAAADTAPSSQPIRIIGTAGTTARTAQFALNLPLSGRHSAAWLTTTK